MNRLFRGLAVAAAVLTGGLLTAGTALASQPGQMRVEDEAGLFSANGVSRAKERFDGTTFKSSTHYAVVTKTNVPAAKQAELDAAVKDENARKRFFGTWARELARKTDRKGDVFTLVFKNEKGQFHVVTVTDEQTDVHRSFGDKKAGDVNNEFLKSLRRAKTDKMDGPAAKKEMDEALLAATQIVIDDLKDTAAPESGSHAQSGHTGTTKAERGGSGIMSWICIGLCVLLGVWLVVGLIRAFTGGGGGPGGGYGGGGYGGGGGGFFPSLLGGLFGAAAGMYLYDSFMGGHHGSSDAMASDTGGDVGDTGDGNWDGGAEAGGGDFGDDAGGGDAGGGDWGGDAGGGGDWGGGGDIGGGGGDFGGGGDW